MDASNPVIDSTRISLSAMREKRHRYQRQDLQWLERVCSTLRRARFEGMPRKIEAEEDVKLVRAKLGELMKKKKDELELNTNYEDIKSDALDFLTPHDPIPVCGLHLDGVPIHPTGKNSSSGKVTTTLSFGGVGFDKQTIEELAWYLETRTLIEMIESSPYYSRGTTRGLQTRLKKQMARPAIPLKMDYRTFEGIIKTAMPVKTDKFLDWNSDLYDLFENVTTSFSSSAGAPYWKPKVEALDEMLDVVLPLVSKEIIQGRLDALRQEQPELFLCVLKNKDDRYEDPVAKTRPYISQPWHFQTLFSVLMQPFCEGLQLFYQQPGCRNAYGFSYANGGGQRLWEYMNKTEKGNPQFIVYGDDVDFFYRTKEGSLCRVCPDFSQMDGSVDKVVVEYTIRWVKETYEKKFGKSEFWNTVCKLWYEFSVNPTFLVEGPTTYKKKTEHGIMTGVVGTTVFDTVKAVLAYEEFVTYNPYPEELSIEQITKFFKDRGLEIKAGTWEPHVVPRYPNIDEPITPQKFLGLQLMRTQYDGKDLFVPTMPEKEWFMNLISPRERENHTSFGKQRYLFDRLRGLLTTGGVFVPSFRKTANALLHGIPGSAIVMHVQSGEGKGRRPEFVASVGKNFEFENSGGWPTVEWALDLYAPEEMKQGVPLSPVYIDPDGVLTKLPKRKPILPIAATVDVVSGGEVVSSSVIPLSPPEDKIVVPDLSAAPLAEKYNPKPVEPFKYSPKLNLVSETGELKKFKPKTLKEQIMNLLKPITNSKSAPLDEAVEELKNLAHHAARKRDKNGRSEGRLFIQQMLSSNEWDIPSQILLGMVLDGLNVEEIDSWALSISAMISLDYLAQKLGQSPKLIAIECRALGYYVLGNKNSLFVTSAPVAPLDKEYKKDQDQQMEENVQNLAVVSKKLRDEPIGPQTSELLSQKRNLAQIVKRAEERPAHLPLSRATLNRDTPFVLAPVANVDARSALKSDKKTKQIAMQKILRGNGITYRIAHVRDKPGDIEVYWTGQNKRDVLVFSGGYPMHPYLAYYKFVLDKYIFDVETRDPALDPFKNPEKDWAELYQTEKNVRIRLFLEQGRPTILHIKNWKPVLVGQHHSLVVKDEPNTVYVRTQDGDKPVSLMHSIQRTSNHLAELLGNQVEVAHLTYSEYISTYPELEKKLKAREYINYLGELQHKASLNNQAKNVNKSASATKTSASRRRSQESAESRGGSSRRSEKRKSTSPRKRPFSKSAPRPKAEVEYEEERYESGGNGWFRLSGYHSNRPARRRGGGEIDNQYLPHRVGRNSRVAGSQFVAAIPAQKSRSRDNHIREQDDGRTVSDSMVRRFRRPRSHQRRRGPQ